MKNIDFTALNSLETQIHKLLSEQSKKVQTIRIQDAANICNCSTSKISKFVKKLGFYNYKQYLDFLYDKEIVKNELPNELERIKLFIENFPIQMSDRFLEIISNHQKIILFGYGPSLLCAQYFEYRLRTTTNKIVIAVADEISISSMTDESSLLIILTVTGNFHSFKKVFDDSKSNGSEVVILSEEYNVDLLTRCDQIFILSNYNQPDDLLPYEKSRTIFFVFLEEIIRRLLLIQKN